MITVKIHADWIHKLSDDQVEDWLIACSREHRMHHIKCRIEVGKLLDPPVRFYFDDEQHYTLWRLVYSGPSKYRQEVIRDSRVD